MKIAALQMVSTPNVDDNLAAAAQLVAEAAAAGARLVVLPEYFCHMGRDDRDKLRLAEADGSGPIQQMLAATAQQHGVWLIGGTLPLRTDDADHAYNACCAYAPDGRRAARYDKMHLFCYDNGRERYDEGRVLRAGSRPVAFDAIVADANASADVDATATAATPDIATTALRVGLSICYDLRFPELYRALMTQQRTQQRTQPMTQPTAQQMAQQMTPPMTQPMTQPMTPATAQPVPQPVYTPCDLLSVPAAFTHTTGQAHWELLLRARAVENQCYLIAAAQGGRHENGRRTWGHSMVVDPWGEVLAVLPEGPGVVLAELDFERLAAVRAQLPALTHRRL